MIGKYSPSLNSPGGEINLVANIITIATIGVAFISFQSEKNRDFSGFRGVDLLTLVMLLVEYK